MVNSNIGKLNLSDDEKILAARVQDFIKRSSDKSVPVFTEFLSDREQAIVSETAGAMAARESMIVFGGYDDAERAVIGFFPDYCMYCEKDELLAEFPFVALKIKCSGFREHSHRDFLGSLLGLGVERSVIGDIIVGEKGYSATVFVLSKMCGYICENLKLVGRDGVKVEPCATDDLDFIERKFESIKGTCASLRLDALMSEMLNLSREKAGKLILEGCVSVNHEESTDKSRQLFLNDVISVKGFGKYRLSSVGDTNRKGRIRFEVQKYI